MRAVYLRKGQLELYDELETFELAPSEARIRVRLAGICSTDLELQRGYMSFSGVPGHEFVGDVIEGPDGWRGARVVGEINVGCGYCDVCYSQLQRHCPSRTVLGILGRAGAHAEELTLPVANLRRVPDHVSDEAAVFAEPLAAAFRITEQIDVAGKLVAVLGSGKLGQLIARACRVMGAHVIGLTRSPRAETLLAAAGIDSLASDAAAPQSFDIVVEATGSAAGLARALTLVRPLGTVVLKTTTHDAAPIDLAPAVVNEVTLVGSRCGSFEPALHALEAGVIDPTPLIGETLPLDQAEEAYARAAQPGSFKVLLRP